MRIEFEEAIGASPPSTVDVDRIIERQRRLSRLRIVGGLAGTVAAVVAVAVGATTLAGKPTPTTPGERPAATPSPVARKALVTDPEKIEATRKRLRDELNRLMRAALGGDQLKSGPHDSDGVYLEAIRMPPGMNLVGIYEGYGKVYRNDKHLGTVHVSVSPNDDERVRQNPPADALPPSDRPHYFTNCAAYLAYMRSDVRRSKITDDGCREQVGPGGETVLVIVFFEDHVRWIHRVYVTAPDGTVVILGVDNANTKADAPIGTDRLVGIATAPGLRL